jgi:hypothetical protein
LALPPHGLVGDSGGAEFHVAAHDTAPVAAPVAAPEAAPVAALGVSVRAHPAGTVFDSTL